MLGRALLRLLPALLALGFLLGSPVAGGAGVEIGVAAGNAARHAPAPIARGVLSPDICEQALTQPADNDDPLDARVIRVETRMVWDGIAMRGRFPPPDTALRPSHHPCAASPRAPPAV